ncbi:Hypp9228 [Branchiostoma lanceolatum]|uniref:Hypp9228 protein n=1 Tax=Branchiostoma lanceolatum TaxID=7740 RepID=A0A8J9ZES1_BRALA|nr:Hypp9228 [Branchiostoma lanceolatum]
MTEFIDIIPRSETKHHFEEGATAKDMSGLLPARLATTGDIPARSSKRQILLISNVYGTGQHCYFTINRQVAQSPPHERADVYCAILYALHEDQKNAKKDRVRLIEPFRETDDARAPTLDWLIFDHQLRYPDLPKVVDCVISYSNITDKAARRIKDHRYPLAQLLIFNQFFPENVHINMTVKKALVYEAENAFAVFSLGTRIYNHFDTMYRMARKRIRHYIFRPRPSQTFLDTEITSGGKEKVVLSFCGMCGELAEKLKETVLAARAMGIATEKIKDASLHVHGISTVEYERSMAFLEHHLKSGRLKPIPVPPGTQEDIRDAMMTAHLVLMTSRSEPFGMIGLEAIAAGIPVLISDKSGLADMIMDLIKEGICHPDRRRRIVHTSVNESDIDEDAKVWAAQILDTLEHIDAEFAKAADFKNELKKSKYWEESHQTFLRACGIASNEPLCSDV